MSTMLRLFLFFTHDDVRIWENMSGSHGRRHSAVRLCTRLEPDRETARRSDESSLSFLLLWLDHVSGGKAEGW